MPCKDLKNTLRLRRIPLDKQKALVEQDPIKFLCQLNGRNTNYMLNSLPQSTLRVLIRGAIGFVGERTPILEMQFGETYSVDCDDDQDEDEDDDDDEHDDEHDDEDDDEDEDEDEDEYDVESDDDVSQQ
jgi:nucleosome binding factor SPN SPT16 subunit